MPEVLCVLDSLSACCFYIVWLLYLVGVMLEIKNGGKGLKYLIITL